MMQISQAFVGLKNAGSNHCFLNSAVQALFNLSSEHDVDDALARHPSNSVCTEVLRVLKEMHFLSSTGGTGSVDLLRAEMAKQFRSTGLFQGRDFGDAYEAFNAILQQLYSSVPEARLVKKFRIEITEKSSCDCRDSQTTQDWSPDCFGLSVFMSGERRFLDQLKEDFQGRTYQMCQKGSSLACSTRISRAFKTAPSILTFQLNYQPNLPISRESSLVEQIDLSQISEIQAQYTLKGAVLMTPGHFYSCFLTHTGWTVFNDSSVVVNKSSSFSDFQRFAINVKPYLLFYTSNDCADLDPTADLLGYPVLDHVATKPKKKRIHKKSVFIESRIDLQKSVSKTTPLEEIGKEMQKQFSLPARKQKPIATSSRASQLARALEHSSSEED
jgi:hypothetical protein